MGIALAAYRWTVAGNLDPIVDALIASWPGAGSD
jgi:hypothetical protein